MKKILIALLLTIGLISFTGCKKNEIDLQNYMIEERENLFVAQDSQYIATYSTGMREENYALDGTKNNMIEFGIITFNRIDSNPLSNDDYTYAITVNGDTRTGFLTKSEIDNSYSVDIGTKVDNGAEVSLKISFTGYDFNQNMNCISNEFSIDKSAAINIANKEFKTELAEILDDKNVSLESIMKIVKDYSSNESKNYFWYIGIVSTNSDTIGILINTTNGEVVAKKV